MAIRDHRALPTVSGIYAVCSLKGGKIDRRYVGSGKNIRKRVNEHVGLLRRGLHPTPRLQNAWSARGEDAFVYEVLEVCLNDPLILVAREDHWIAKHKGRLYNARLAAEQFSSEWHRTEEAKAVHAEHGKKLAKWWESRGATERTCRHCGGPFLSRTTSERAWYCSVRCRHAARKEAGKLGLTRTPIYWDRTCEHCGKTFATRKGKKTRFCSLLCSNHADSKIRDSDVVPIIERVVGGEKIRDVARSFGVDRLVIHKIVTRQTRCSVALPPDLAVSLDRYWSAGARRKRASKVDLSREAVQDILNRLAAGEHQWKIARDYGVSQAAVSDIRTGATKWWEGAEVPEVLRNRPVQRRAPRPPIELVAKAKALLAAGMSREDVAKESGLRWTVVYKLSKGLSYVDVPPAPLELPSPLPLFPEAGQPSA